MGSRKLFMYIRTPISHKNLEGFVFIPSKHYSAREHRPLFPATLTLFEPLESGEVAACGVYIRQRAYVCMYVCIRVARVAVVRPRQQR